MSSTTIELAPGCRTQEEALDIVAQAAASLFIHGQTTERVIAAAEQLGKALGMSVHVLPHWGELVVEIDGAPRAEIVPATPLGVDMGRVLAVMNVVDRVSDGTLPPAAARAALAATDRVPPASTPRFVTFCAIAASALGVIFGAFDPASLLLIAASAGLGALVRRGLARLAGNPFIQPLCAAAIAGIIAALAARWGLTNAPSLVAFCPCMVLVPGPHILNGAIDLARTRVALGADRLTYAGMIVLMICSGVLAGLAVSGGVLAAGPSPPVPLLADVVAAGCAVAGFGTFFSMPWRMLPFPIAVGMLAHAARWALISLAGANVAAGALVACLLAGVIVAPVVDRLRLPFAAVAFSAVVSMMPGFFLFHAASALSSLVLLAPGPSAELVTNGVANGATAFMIVLAMTFGLILPRMLFVRFLPAPAPRGQRPARRNLSH